MAERLPFTGVPSPQLQRMLEEEERTALDPFDRRDDRLGEMELNAALAFGLKRRLEQVRGT